MSLEKAVELSGGSDEALAELGYVFAVSGDSDKARTTLKELIRPNGPASHYRLAIIYMGLGETDKALDALEQAVKERSPGVVHLKVSPLFRNVRTDKRFMQLLRDVGLST